MPPYALQSSFKGDSHNLDLIRATAVLCVFFAHLSEIATGHAYEAAWHFAQMGVIIFFVHTSFVLMLSLERSTLKLQGKAMFKEFYLRRFFRLYPLSIVCVLTAFVMHESPDVQHVVRNWTLKELASNLTLTTNLTYSDNMWGGLWTLPLEVQMYLVLPVLFLVFRTRQVALLFVVWALSIPVALLQPHVSGRLNVLGFVPCFLGGVLAWKLSTTQERRYRGALWPLAFVAICPLFILTDRSHNMWFRWLFCVTLGCVLPFFKEISFKPLRRAAQTVAKYSYGVYLSHIFVMQHVFRLHLPSWERWTLFAIFATAAPYICYHLIEHPLIKVGSVLSNRFFTSKGEVVTVVA